MEKSEKEEQVKYLTEQFGSCAIALCADYRGLTVEEISVLRKGLREKGSAGKVVKNTLAKISVQNAYGADGEEAEVQKFTALFHGPSLVIFSEEDPVAPAKVLADFAKEHEALEIKGGWFEGEFLDEAGVKNLSSMPSKEEVFSKLLSVLSAPATKVVQLLQAPGTQTVQVLNAYKTKLEEES